MRHPTQTSEVVVYQVLVTVRLLACFLVALTMGCSNPPPPPPPAPAAPPKTPIPKPPEVTEGVDKLEQLKQVDPNYDPSISPDQLDPVTPKQGDHNG